MTKLRFAGSADDSLARQFLTWIVYAPKGKPRLFPKNFSLNDPRPSWSGIGKTWDAPPPNGQGPALAITLFREEALPEDTVFVTGMRDKDGNAVLKLAVPGKEAIAVSSRTKREAFAQAERILAALLPG